MGRLTYNNGVTNTSLQMRDEHMELMKKMVSQSINLFVMNHAIHGYTDAHLDILNDMQTIERNLRFICSDIQIDKAREENNKRVLKNVSNGELNNDKTTSQL